MGLFDRLFGNTIKNEPQPDIRFGRYSDSYKSDEQYDYWDSALDAFEEEEYLKSYRHFFAYLKDGHEGNVELEEKEGDIHFKIYQGSKIVFGIANAQKVKAESKVAKYDHTNVGFMRRLMERNFGLKYSRFALDDENNIAITFDTYTLDGSPFKLYYALKEMATNADKQDDLLIDEFEMLHELGSEPLETLADTEKEIKYQYIQKEIQRCFDYIDSNRLDSQQYPGGIAYLFLHLAYKLDYLTRPEGFMMETLERIHRMYFAKDNKSTFQRNIEIRKEFQKLLKREKVDFFKEMYDVKATFGITTPINQDRLSGFIDGELKNMDWYLENGHHEVALAVTGYITGYCMFNWAPPRPARELLHLFFEITEPEYFQSLDFSFDYYNPIEKTFNKAAIKREIYGIAKSNARQYPDCNPSTSILDYNSLAAFAKSFLLMIKELDLVKAI